LYRSYKGQDEFIELYSRNSLLLRRFCELYTKGFPMYRITWMLLFVFASIGVQAQTNLSESVLEFGNATHKELSLSEWKKFKSFEQKLTLSQRAQTDGSQQLQNYVRDSLQILTVKLMAVKLLDERALLHKDIAENQAYYNVLLNELRESDIPPTAYVFLEEKMAFLNQGELKRKLSQSNWLNAGLGVLCLVLVFVVFRLKMKPQKVPSPELSKQELTVKSLILQGKSNKEIANELFISLSTVKSHITNLYAKLQVANRQELVQNSTGAST